MRRITYLLLIMLIPVLSYSQGKQQANQATSYYPTTAKSKFIKIDLKGLDVEKEIRNYLRSSVPTLNHALTDLRLLTLIESPGGSHYTFEQTFSGVSIYQSQIKVNLDRQNNIRSIFISDFDTRQWDASFLKNQTFDLESSLAYQNFVEANLKDDLFQTEVKEAIGFDFLKNQPLFVYHVKFTQEYGSFNTEALFTSVSTLFFRDLNVHFLPPDSASGKVFNPDPLTTAHVNYGIPYIDNGDLNSPELTNELVDKDFLTTFSGGVYNLANDHIVIMDFDAPAVIPQTSATPLFNFTRDQFGFEEVNALYHISRYQEYIRSLGFTNLVNYQIQADVYALGGQDQSLFQPGSPISRLLFGEGCVDDAEDADVLIHEYGHAISHAAAPNSNIGGERTALDEGFGDYVAATYSACLDTFNSNRVFSWDGNNECWTGRDVATSKTYPDDLMGSIHLNGEIWSSTLMQINEVLGKELANQIVFQSLFGYSSNMKMTHAAQLLLQADSFLTGGNNFCGLYPALRDRGLIDSIFPDPCNFKDLSILADAGPDTVICKNAPIILGGNPASTGADKSFLWTPNEYMEDNKQANPIALPDRDITYSLRVERPDGFFNDDQINIVVIPCPNPALFVNSQSFINGTGVMSIVFPFDFKEARVRMYNGIGQLLLDEQGITSQKYEVDPSAYTAGHYIFHIAVDTKTFGKKLVKAR